MATTYGNKLSVWSTYLDTTFNANYSATQASLSIKVGVYFNSRHEHTKDYDTFWTTPANSTNNSTISGAAGSGDITQNAGTRLQYTTRTIYFNKGTASFTGKITASIKHAKGTESWRGTSTTSQSFTIPTRATYAVKYNGNIPSGASGTISGVPSNQTKYYGYNLTLSSIKPQLADWTFQGWNTEADGSGTSYAAGAAYSGNAALTLYAQWSKVYIAPIIGSITLNRVETSSGTQPYDEGNYLCVTLSDYISGDVPADGANRYKQTTMSLDITASGNTYTLTPLDTSTFTGVGTTKNIHYSVPTTGYSPSYPTSDSYPITLTFTTVDHGSFTYITRLASSVYPIDIASDASIMAFGVPTRIKKDLYLDVDANAASGTVDAELYDALVALGWWDTISNGGVLAD